MDFTKFIPSTLSRDALFRQDGYHLWDPCIVQSDDGLYHLFYSRWPDRFGHCGWCTHAEIAWATADHPAGPYRFQSVVLPARGYDYWDGHSVYNTCVTRIGGQYYLYYTGNRGSKDWEAGRAIEADSPEWWVHRNNQRIGVAVADSPAGPWRRFDQPLLDVGPGVGQTIVAVPNIVIKPEGGYRLYYKTLAEGDGPYGGGVFHYSADADDPLGPFIPHPQPMVDKNKLLPGAGCHFDFHIDDHFEWVQNGRYFAIVKDHDAPYLTEHGKSLILFESPDGRNWQLSENALVKTFSVTWEDGETIEYDRLEMPKILFEQGRPTVLSLAAKVKASEESYLIIMPLLSAE